MALLYRKTDSAAFAAHQLFQTYTRELHRSIDHFRADLDQNSLHDIRVATRRLQVILRVFRKYLPAKNRLLRNELRWLRHALDRSRDFNVQKKFIGRNRGRAMRVLKGRIASQAEEADRHSCDALASRRVSSLTRSLDEHSNRAAKLRGKKTKNFFPKAIHKAVRRFNRSLPENRSDNGLHRLRLEIKKMRYTLELFPPLQTRKLKTLLKIIKRLQDLLGDYHDLVNDEKFLSDFEQTRQDQNGTGPVLRRISESKSALRREFQPIWKRFKKRKKSLLAA